MRYELPSTITKEYLGTFMSQVISPLVYEVRKDLAIRYNVNTGPYLNYTGLCDEASEMFKHRLDTYTKTFLKSNKIIVEIHHGEQKHLPTISSWHWGMQHTWNVVYLGEFKIYVDCTCGQFSDFYPRMPQYYVSIKPQPWFIDDRDNRTLDRSMWKINKIIKIPTFGEKHITMVGITDYISYYVWGAISDLIGSIFGIRKLTEEDDL